MNEYKLKFFKQGEGADWKDIAEQVEGYVNEIGADQGHKISISNFSFGEDNKMAVILSWDLLKEQNLVDQTRNEGCCTIF
mmetsp:Transcript_24844/g.17557  ORF Transcript_24844/g.17557 Transcript_24844/m.17557 type:complete len:80 (-) Transcript_24844:101-340(-)